MLETQRQEIIAQRVETANQQAEEQEQLETELGGPRTSASGGIPTTERELQARIQSVPEPSTPLVLLLLGLGFSRFKVQRNGDRPQV